MCTTLLNGSASNRSSLCHVCYDVIDFCQGHGEETCTCICDEGCYCGDCGFDDSGIPTNFMIGAMFDYFSEQGATVSADYMEERC